MREKVTSINERKVLRGISKLIKENQYSPTIEEIAKETVMASSTVYRIILQLEQKGILDHKQGKARTLHFIW